MALLKPYQKGVRTALATVEGVKTRNEQRLATKNETTNTLSQPSAGFSQGFAGTIANRIDQLVVRNEATIRTEIKASVSSGNAVIEAIYELADPMAAGFFALPLNNIPAQNFIRKIRNELVRLYMANGPLQLPDITSVVQQFADALPNPPPFVLPPVDGIVVNGINHAPGRGGVEAIAHVIHTGIGFAPVSPPNSLSPKAVLNLTSLYQLILIEWPKAFIALTLIFPSMKQLPAPKRLV